MTDLSPLWISLKTSFCATVLTFVLGTAAALAMSRYRGRARGIIDGVLTLPLVLPPTVVGFFLLLAVGRRSTAGQLLERIGITIAFSWPATVLAATVVAFPLMYRAALGGFEQVNPNLIGAARTLGAGEWRTFRRVLLPLAWPGVMAGTVLAFARALGEFGATLMLAGNIPGRTQTMPLAVFFAAEGGDMRGALTWVLLTVALSLVSIAALNHWGRRGLSVTIPRTVAEPPEFVHIVPHPSGAGATVASLEVDIRKRLRSFELAVAFSRGRGTLGLLGASGSGKTMTLRSIAGLETPDEGRIVLNGRVLFDRKLGISLPPRERRVGIMFQDYALFPHLTVRENIAFGLHGRPRDEASRTVERWARMLQIEGLLERYPDELSGGQRQRTALARALAMEPEALLLDEPFAALDPHLRRQVEEQMRAVLHSYSGATLFVTHDRDNAYRLCSRLVVLADGRVTACGPRDDLFENPMTLAAARVTGCKNLAAFERTGPDRIHVGEWGCTLHLDRPVPDGTAFVGIRAHHVEFVDLPGENTFPCRFADAVESPFEVTVYLRLGDNGGPPNLEAEMAKGLWAVLSRNPQPWHVRLDPIKLLLLRE